MLLFLLFVFSLTNSAVVYINSPDDILIFNFTCTTMTPTLLENARINCKDNSPLCAYLTVQNSGDYIGQQQWGFLNIHHPPYVPYTCAETGAFNIINGSSINQIYPKLDICAAIEANVLTPACEIGTEPSYDTVTGEQICTPQVDASTSSFLYSNIWTYVGIGVVIFIVLFLMYYSTYLADGWYNMKFVAPVNDYAIDGYTSAPSLFSNLSHNFSFT